MTYSLRRPLAGLTGFQRLIWPLIFLQLVALKRWVRAHYGRGVPYWYGLTAWGRVYLRHLPTDFAASYAAAGALSPPALATALFKPSARLAAALAPEPRAVPQPVPCARKPSVHSLSAPAHADTS
jgi:hypothetical protein